MMKKLIGLGLALAMIGTNAFAAEHTHNWCDDIAHSTEDLNVYVCECGEYKYENVCDVKEPIITFDANGGIVAATTIEAKYGKVKMPICENTSDYQFEGWFTGREDGYEVNSDYVFSQDTTLYAHWSVIGEYTLTFAVDGGEEITSVKMPYGTVLSLESFIPVKKGNKFEGWYSDPRTKEQKVCEVTFDENKVVYAKWKPTRVFMMSAVKPEPVKTVLPNGWVIFKTANGIVDVKCTPLWAEQNARLTKLMKQYNEKFN